MKGTTTLPDKYKDDDFLTLSEAAEAVGYTIGHMTRLFSPGTDGYDPSLRTIRIRTDETFRKAFGTQAQYVFQYKDVKRWFNDRQSRPSVQTYNEGHGIIVE